MSIAKLILMNIDEILTETDNLFESTSFYEIKSYCRVKKCLEKKSITGSEI
tara:strand:+ start:62 stop:214 length:153 start_codon:yes stop_codon:yes gene_type:complete